MSTVAERPLSASHVTDPMMPDLYRVQRVHPETHDTFTLELRPQARKPRLAFEPGQFNMLYVFGTGEVPLSVSGNPAGAALVHTTRAVGRVTNEMSRLRAGDVIGVRGPFGTPWPMALARGHDLVIVAGGIGLPPLRPVLYHVLSHRDDFGRVVLLYGTRTPEDILFRAELERWRARFDLELDLTVDRGTPSWHGNVGVVTSLIPRAPFDARSAFAMICGPEVMIRFTAIELERRGVATDHIYVSLERNMKCAVGFCGHCQFGPHFVCRDGPVFPYDRVEELVNRWEV